MKNNNLWKQFPAEFKCWSAMKQRCYNPKNPQYKNYGVRGIIVCEQWLNKKDGFRTFMEDMGARLTPNHSIDRRNTNGNYEPSNCYWATDSQQNNNTRRNINLTYDGKTRTMQQWSEELGIPYDRLHARYKYKWSVDNILRKEVGKNTKVKAHHNRSNLITYNGSTLTIAEWSRKLDLPYSLLRARKNYGWKPIDILTKKSTRA